MDSEMMEIAKSFFVDLFTSHSGIGGRAHILSGIKRYISEANNALLTAKYMEDEVLLALKEMGPTKALGVDGFLALFF